MTSTISPSVRPAQTADDALLAPPGGTSAAASAGPSGESPRRRRSRFPVGGPEASGSPSEARGAVLYRGPEGALRELVRDHATAVGAELAAAPSARVACEVRAAEALAVGTSLPAPGGVPLLVVTAADEVPSSLWPLALAAGAQAVLPLPAASAELLSRLTSLTRTRTGARMLGVVGGCGGAGASSFAARLAGAARRDGPVILIDADPLGGGLDLLVEAPGTGGLDWSRTATLGPDDGAALRDGLPVVDEVRVLVAGERPGPEEGAVARVLAALAPLGGTVVVDLAAPAVPEIADHLDELLVVVPSGDHAVRAAARRLRAWGALPLPVRVVVRRSGPLTPAEVAEDLALPLAAAFRDSPRGTVPLLDVRRRGADRAARELLAGETGAVGS